MAEEFGFRGLTFRPLSPFGLEVRVGGKWYLTDYINRRALEQMGDEIPDISLWNEKRSVIGNVRFPVKVNSA